MLDSYSRALTRESVESTKKWLQYESFEYESRPDPSLLSALSLSLSLSLPPSLPLCPLLSLCCLTD